MTLSLRFSALSDVGRVRKENQDSGYAGAQLLLVADGVGGAARGDVASATTIHQMRVLDTAPEQPAGTGEEVLVGAIGLAHTRISDLVAESPELEGTSTTVVAGFLQGNELAIAHVGDSRGYLFRDGVLTALTRDHSFVQSLVDEGRITEEEARVHPNRNLILRAVDGVHEPNPDTSRHVVTPGDRLLLCSDGCCGVLTDEQIAEILANDDLDHVATTLVTASLDAGSTDNVTVVVADVIEDGRQQPPVTVGAAAHPLRPTSRTGRLRRKLTEIVVDPEVARYAPRPPRRGRFWRFSLIVVVLLGLAAAILYGGYRWTQTQYYIGADENGYVTSYQGVPGSVFGFSLSSPLYHSALNVSALDEINRKNVSDTPSFGSAAKAKETIESLIERTCPTPEPTPTTKPRGTKPSATNKKHGSTHKPSASATPTPKPGCPQP